MRNGEADELSVLYADAAQRLVRTIERRFPRLGRADAEDVVQQAFLEALEVGRRLAGFRPTEGWLSKRARQRAIDLTRLAATRVEPLPDGEPSDDGRRGARRLPADPRPPPEVAALDQLVVREALGAIPGRLDRRCTVLKLHGYREREIAERLGLSYETRHVQSRLRRVQRRLLATWRSEARIA